MSMLIGITGCPGSGKTTLSKIIEKYGWINIDVDKIGHDMIQNNDIKKHIVDEFGNDVLFPNNNINRKILGEKIFSNHESLIKFNNIIHPPLIKKVRNCIKEHNFSNGKNVIIDCALLFEWHIDYMFDYTITMISDESVRIDRLIERDNKSISDIKNIFSSQLTEIEKIYNSDIVFKNNDDIDKLKLFGKMIAASALF